MGLFPALLLTRPCFRRIALVLVFISITTTIAGICFHDRTQKILSEFTHRQLEEISAELGSAVATENFPLLDAANAHPPPILRLNRPSKNAPVTPLLIGFTRNWPILQQAVVSYLAAGWPAEQIYVVDNSGVMDSNRLGLLSLQNPFYMNNTRLTQGLGVNVLTTPTLLTFAQLQNYFLSTAIEHKWTHYWWSHMDTVVVSSETVKPYKSAHQQVVEDVIASGPPESWKWAIKFFHYDSLAAVNVAAYKDVGGWDTHIPFYSTDCDMYARLKMQGWKLPSVEVGKIFDVGGTLGDLRDFYPSTENEALGGERYTRVLKELAELEDFKHKGGSRNFWQGSQRGGKGEPFYKDPVGFEKGIRLWIEFGRKVYSVKWDTSDCDIIGAGKKIEHLWQHKEIVPEKES